MVFGNLLAILLLLLPLGTWLAKKRLPWIAGSTLRWFIACFVLCSALYIGALVVGEMELRWAWEKYDLDRNGEISPAEMTPAAQEAMHRWSADTGRNFALILAIPASLVWTTVNFIVLASLGWLWSRIRTGKPGKIGKKVKVVLACQPPQK